MLNFIYDEADLLVEVGEAKWQFPLFVTLSPNPGVKVPIRRTKSQLKKDLVKKPYGQITHKEQYDYCIDMVRKMYLGSDTQVFGTWELNSSKNVHLHMIISDPSVINDTTLAFYQRTISNMDYSQVHMGAGKFGKKIDRMNSIVKVNDSVKERFKYLTKDMKENLPLLPYFSMNCPGMDQKESPYEREEEHMCRIYGSKRKGVNLNIEELNFNMFQ